MPIHIVRNDITKMDVDAIVNAAKPSLLGGGGVDGAIHRAAGPELLEECRTLGGCERGQAKITRGYRLPSKYVIHTVGPIWYGGDQGEREVLSACYRSSMELAVRFRCRSVAFPLISAGIYGYPKDQAMRVAMDSIASFLMDNDQADDMTVYMVLYSRDSLQLGHKLSDGIREYIDDNYVSTHRTERDERRREWENSLMLTSVPDLSDIPAMAAEQESAPPAPKAKKPYRRKRESAAVGAQQAPSLGDAVRNLDESFQQMLLRKIDEKGLTDAQCYKKANVDRKLFSKIRGDVHYRPSKRTAVALAVALELDMSETRELLLKAGYVIVEYFILNRHYDIFEINEALFAYDQAMLGS